MRKLLSVSGYAQLLQLATLFRNESTDPSISQTVRTFPPVVDRRPLPSQTVTIESEPVPLAGAISASARRELQNNSVSLEIWTQPLLRIQPIEYQIRLRTLKSIWGSPPRWREPAYGAYQFLHYEPVLGDRDFLELMVDERDAALAAELLVAGHSPSDESIHRSGVATLTAHTFDWWIPVRPPFSLDVPLERTEKSLRGLGHMTTAAVTSPLRVAADLRREPGARFARTSDSAFENSVPRLSFLDGTPEWEGEHREPREADITLSWSLDWDADRLHIELKADSTERNYVVYVAIEEQLQGGKGNVLHTAIPVPVNGQLTFVPQSFFDAERDAIENNAVEVAVSNGTIRRRSFLGAMAALPAGVLAQPQTADPSGVGFKVAAGEARIRTNPEAP